VIDREGANAEALRRLCDSAPVLVDVQPAGEIVPGFEPNLILTSGAPLPFAEYTGGQRDAIIGAALFEGLAASRDDAVAKLESGDIRVDGCHDYGCVGSLAGVYTASMPVLVVANPPFGNTGFCNFYEGKERRRLNYGCYDEGVHSRLQHVSDVLAPILGEAVRRRGGVELGPIMRRAVQMGDELHSRSAAATLLFEEALALSLLDLVASNGAAVRALYEAFDGNDYHFLRLSMAACKVTCDAAHGIEGSSVVTAMTFSSQGFAIRVSGLDATWFRGPHAAVQAKLFEGHTEEEITWMGGESIITETAGLGGFAQAAALPLQRYQGGSAQAMIDRNRELYRITVGEHTSYQIPLFDYRGTPTGIDVLKVVNTGITPAMDVGIPGRDGGQIGAGFIRAPFECFEAAAAAYRERYG
jgi:Protein of unknown function (DUF1116)